ncbi:FtsW/RodA/SpoVE family cell cycle protein [soil metagenome]
MIARAAEPIRRDTAALLGLAMIATGLGLLSVYLSRDGSDTLASPEFKAGLIYIATLLAVWLSLRYARFAGDPFLLPVSGMLGGIGLIVAVRLEPDLASVRGLNVAIGDRQLWYLCAGFLVMWMVALFAPNPEMLAKYRYSVLFAGLALLGLTALLGADVNGSRLWLEAGPIQVQSAELVKLALVVFLAAYLSDNLELVGASWRVGRFNVPPIPYLAPMGVMWGLCVAALLVLNDLGAALLFFSLFLVMLYAANGRLSQFMLGALLFVLAFGLAYLLVPRVEVRVDNWRDPWSDPFGSGYQQIQAEYALSSGGVLGSGLGEGSPWLIPEVQTDYVIAAIGEELGFAGLVVVMGLFMVLAGRGVLIARAAPGGYLKLLSLGLSAGLVVQSIIILGGVLRLMPLTGVTLPLISYGGSSIIVTCATIGVLMRISAIRRAPGRAGVAGRPGLSQSANGSGN